MLLILPNHIPSLHGCVSQSIPPFCLQVQVGFLSLETKNVTNNFPLLLLLLRPLSSESSLPVTAPTLRAVSCYLSVSTQPSSGCVSVHVCHTPTSSRKPAMNQERSRPPGTVLTFGHLSTWLPLLLQSGEPGWWWCMVQSMMPHVERTLQKGTVGSEANQKGTP